MAAISRRACAKLVARGDSQMTERFALVRGSNSGTRNRNRESLAHQQAHRHRHRHHGGGARLYRNGGPQCRYRCRARDGRSLRHMGLLSGQDDPRGDAARRTRALCSWKRRAGREPTKRRSPAPSPIGRPPPRAKIRSPRPARGARNSRPRPRESKSTATTRNAAKETYEFASGALELGILLASSAIVTGLLPLAFIGGAFGAIGAVLGLLGWFAPHLIGG